MKFTRSKTSVIACALGVFAAVLASGCSNTVTSTAPTGTAPRSSISREHALNLAKLTASTIGGQVFTVAPTGSMKPTLDESSIVAVEKVAFEQLQKGDIVIYRSVAGAPVIHRLHERQDGRWHVLGDNNASVDRETVTATNFVGRVCAIFYTAADTPLEGSPAVAVAQR